jgi:hypothetical protein
MVIQSRFYESSGYTGLFGELEHLKIKTRLINEMSTSVMGEYVFWLFIIMNHLNEG